MNCTTCGRKVELSKALCFQCLKQIHKLSQKHSSEKKISSLFSYQEPLRSLIISAKVDRNIRSYHAIKKIFLARSYTKQLATWANYVAPAPSSLWSRAHLKYDLAYMLAYHLSRQYQITLISPPFLQGWKVSKQSKATARQKSAWENMPELHGLGDKKLLLIDDVTTSGETLYHLEKAFPTYYAKALCLADAS